MKDACCEDSISCHGSLSLFTYEWEIYSTHAALTFHSSQISIFSHVLHILKSSIDPFENVLHLSPMMLFSATVSFRILGMIKRENL